MAAWHCEHAFALNVLRASMTAIQWPWSGGTFLRTPETAWAVVIFGCILHFGAGVSCFSNSMTPFLTGISWLLAACAKLAFSQRIFFYAM